MSKKLHLVRELLGMAFLLSCAVYFSIQLMGVYRYQMPMMGFAVIPAMLLFLYGYASCCQRFGMIRELLVMSLLGYIGMLMGLMADYGELGLLALTNELCRIPEGSNAGAAWWDRASQAPWMHVGMFIGCNLGGCWQRLLGQSSQRMLFLRVTMLANLGMLLGMSLSHNLFPPPDGNLVRQLLQMPIQMSLLMAGAMIVFREGALYLYQMAATCGETRISDSKIGDVRVCTGNNAP